MEEIRNTYVAEAVKVSKHYMLGKTKLDALMDINLKVKMGDFMVIAGPSGSGKTTLLNLIGCIDRPSSGSIKIEGVDTIDLPHNLLADIRKKQISFIFQAFNLIPVLNAFENVEYPLLNRKLSKDKRKELAMNALENVGLRSFHKHLPNQLSGGQRQRVAIARALVTSPKIILADEPTASLDHNTGVKILQLMKEINCTQETTFIFSSHDPKIINLADKIVYLEDGRIADRKESAK